MIKILIRKLEWLFEHQTEQIQSKDNYKGLRKMLHTDKMANSQSRYNNPKGACSHQQSFKIFQKLVELKEKIQKFTIIGGDFNTPFLLINRTNRQKISRDQEN